MMIVSRQRLNAVFSMPPVPPRALWTLVGASAVPMWATWPLLATLTVAEVPLFQYLAIIFGVGSLTLFALHRVTGSAPLVSGRGLRGSVWAAAAMVGLGLLVSDILFILALRQIPAAEANLLLYLWPLMVVGLAWAVGLVRLRRLHLIAMALGAAGAVLVLGARPENLGSAGAALALLGGLVWAVYVVFRMWQGEAAPDALARGLGLSAVASLALHLGLESWVTPPPMAFLGMVLVGIVPLALGNHVWDVGARRGDRVALATFAYATPLVSTLLLAVAGYAAPGIGLVLGGAFIVLGGVLASRAG